MYVYRRGVALIFETFSLFDCRRMCFVVGWFCDVLCVGIMVQLVLCQCWRVSCVGMGDFVLYLRSLVGCGCALYSRLIAVASFFVCWTSECLSFGGIIRVEMSLGTFPVALGDCWACCACDAVGW